MPILLIYFMILCIFLFYLWEWKTLIKQRHWRDLTVALIFLFIALGYGLDYAWGLNMLPNPNLLFDMVKPVSEAFEKFFQVAG
ncbi:MAG: hypothetical protein ABFD18_00545 [Syntrophomonas sp.]